MSAETAPAYKVPLLDVSSKDCMIKVDSGVLINHAELLKETIAKYPMIRTELKMNTCPTGSGTLYGKRYGLTIYYQRHFLHSSLSLQLMVVAQKTY